MIFSHLGIMRVKRAFSSPWNKDVLILGLRIRRKGMTMRKFWIIFAGTSVLVFLASYGAQGPKVQGSSGQMNAQVTEADGENTVFQVPSCGVNPFSNAGTTGYSSQWHSDKAGLAAAADKEVVKQQKNLYANAVITIKIIPAANNTFGYDVLLYGRPLVHQPSVPGLPGNEGFSTKERAQTVAELVVKKIRNNEMPPTVTIEDLNKMEVLK